MNSLLATPSWFDDPAAVAALRATAAALVGTPFAENSEVPGPLGGMDCVHLVHYVDRTLGLIPPLTLPAYRVDVGQHVGRSLLLEAFATMPELVARFRRVWRRTDELEGAPLRELRAALRPGDHLFFRHGRLPHHAGLYLGAGEFLHTLRRDGAHLMRLDAVVRGWSILGQLQAVYRPLPSC